MNIVLIGFMCSGKSRVGEALSKKLGWPHYDTDQMISKQIGSSVADIIRKQGEAAFREVESKAVLLVSALDKSVISTGGGVPMNAGNMKALSQNAQVVWLQVSPETVLKRAGDLKSRPLIDAKDPIGSIKRLMADREIFYAQANHQIDAEGLDTNQVAEKILHMIPSLAA